MPTDRVDEIMGKWREEAERGRLVDPEALLESHPEHAEELADRFAAQALVDHYYAEADSLPLVTPKRIGDYRIVGEIGRGGMGVVYEAVQESMGRRIALKVLYPTIATTVRTMKRFEREARVTGRLHHTNVVTVYAMGRDAGYVYFAMELIEGQPLDKVIEHLGAQERGEPTSEPMQRLASGLCGRGRHERLALTLAGVADALHVAHAHGVVHRDVKPSNLVLDGDGELKLTDFGLAQLVGEDFGVTRTGEVLGTPMYMSPEQVRARRDEVDQRTDVYSLGATLYELLSLTPPHDGKDLGALCSQILTEEPRPLGVVAPQVPQDLATIAHKALQKQRGDRYSTAGEMGADLRAFGEGRPISARRLGVAQRAWRTIKRHPIRAGLASIALLLAALGLWLDGRVDDAVAQHEEAAYESLLLRGHATAAVFTTPATPNDGFHASSPATATRAHAFFSEALRLLPERPDAWLGRALLAERPAAERLLDLDAARARGLAERTYRLGRAFVFLEANRGAEAAAEHERAESDASPKPLDALFEGWLLTSQGQHEAGLEKLDRAVETAPRTHYVRFLALMYRGLAHLGVGNWTLAVNDLSSIAGQGAHDPASGIHLAYAWARVGQPEQAERIVTDSIRAGLGKYEVEQWQTMLRPARMYQHATWTGRILDAALAQHPSSSRLRMLSALHRGAEGDGVGALRLAEEAMRSLPAEGPARTEVLFYRATLLAKGRRHQEACAAYRLLLREHPGHILVLCNFGRVLAASGRFDEGVAMLRDALQRAPNLPFAHEALASVLANHGEQLDEALSLAKRALALAPNRGAGYGCLSGVYLARGEHDKALQAIDHALRLAPDNGRYRRSRAAHLNNLGRHEDALESTEAPEDQRLAAYIRGYAFEHLKRWDEALAAYSLAFDVAQGVRSLELDASIAQARVLRALGRLEEAASAVDAAMKYDNPGVDAQLNRADELRAHGRLRTALREVSTAERRAPANSRAVLLHTAILASLSRHQEVLEVLAAAEARGMNPATFSQTRVNALLDLGRHQECLDECELFLEGCEDLHYEAVRGQLLCLLGRVDEGVAALKSTCESAPENVEFACALASILIKEKRYTEAYASLRRVPKAKLTSEHLLILAEALAGLSQWTEMFAVLERVEGSYRDGPFYVSARLRALFQLRRFQDVIDEAGAILKRRAGAEAYWAHHYRALALIELRRWDEASVDLKAKLTGGEQPLGAYLQLMQTLAYSGRIDAALSTLQRAAEQHGNSSTVRFQKFLLLLRAGRLREAIELSAVFEERESYAKCHVILALRVLAAADAPARATALRGKLPPHAPPSWQAYILAVAGKRKGAAAQLAVPWSPEKDRLAGAWMRAAAAALLGKRDIAVAEAERYLELLAAGNGVLVKPPDPALSQWKQEKSIAEWFRRWEQQKRMGASAR